MTLYRKRHCFIVQHSPHFILATAGFSEVCDGRELSMDGLSIKPPIIQIYHSLLCVFFITELERGVRVGVVSS